MSVWTVCGIAVLGLVVTVTLRMLRPDFAVYTGLITTFVLLSGLLTPIGTLIKGLVSLSEGTGFSVYTELILKTLGIGLISQVTSDVCRESGASAIASKVEFAAKILILGLCVPIFTVLLEYIEGFLG